MDTTKPKMASPQTPGNQHVDLDDTLRGQGRSHAMNRTPRDNLGNCNFFQINLHHSKLASAELMARLQNETTFIAMVQEPWLGPKHKIYGLKLGTTHAVPEEARAAVVTSKDLGAWPCAPIHKHGCSNGMHTFRGPTPLPRISLYGWQYRLS